jgi:hypothetical protein
MQNLKTVDWIVIFGLIIALIVGVITFKHFRQTGGNTIEATSQIGFQVFIRGVTLTGGQSPIKAGDKTFISIRNVPYSELSVIDVRINPRQMVVPNPKPSKEKFIMIDDLSQMFLYDMVVTLVDIAKITKDGAVVGGNKIKIGLPITLEGENYKINGTISDVRLLPNFSESPQQAAPKPGEQKPEPPKPDIAKPDKNLG